MNVTKSKAALNIKKYVFQLSLAVLYSKKSMKETTRISKFANEEKIMMGENF